VEAASRPWPSVVRRRGQPGEETVSGEVGKESIETEGDASLDAGPAALEGQ
jgi:hypothetical protein